MDGVLTVKDLKTLNALQNHSEGEVAFCEEEQSYMMYTHGEWMPIKATVTDSGLQIDYYTLNKQLISQLPPFDETRINDAKDTIAAWGTESIYMLYGREINYFTLFQKQEHGYYDSLGNALFDCLSYLTDTIYAFDVTADNNIEIWIQYQDITTVLYLFNYEDGVVTYGE